MNSPSALRLTFASALLLVVLPWGVEAQTSRTKTPPRLPSNPSQSSQIPGGVDTGTPATSSNLPLGTPVPPDSSSDQIDQRTRSAAARAAARPDPLTRTGVPLTPSKTVVGPAVIRDASRPAAHASGVKSSTSSTGTRRASKASSSP